MDRKRILSFLVSLFAVVTASAQFYTTGEDPGGLRWYSISSENYKIIYPEGLDSLAGVYGNLLEKYSSPVGASIGVKPNGYYRKPIPVILHSYKAEANGAVTWTPHRMELYTGANAYHPDVMSWETNLAIHESRHVAQMQEGKMQGFGAFNWLTGELFGGAFSALYAGPAFFEGDAVVTETALSASGRGRSADFLEYYRVSFDAGDFRDWYQWRYGSLDKYTPTYYAAGYMLVGGIRYKYDSPLFAKEFYDNIHDRRLIFPFFNLQYTVKDISGQKLRDAWQEICATQNAIWKADELSRGPFKETRQLTPDSRRYTEYGSPMVIGNEMIALRRSITSTPRLVKIDSLGKVKALRPFSSVTSDIRYSEPAGRIFWSENIPDIRWTMASTSRIFSADPSGRKVRVITKKGRLFNPAPSPDGTRISVTEYPTKGGTAINVIDAIDGHILEHYPAPDSLQVVETVWVNGRIAASAISASGFGIYSVNEGYTALLKPQPAKIKQLRSSGGQLFFVSDRSGVNELYSLDASGNVIQMSNNRFGASDFVIGKDSLTFAALTVDGRQLYRSQAEPRAVDYGDLYHHPVADRLSEQEAAIGHGGAAGPEDSAAFSEPERYRKTAHLIHLHSWLPLYFDYDEISSISFESLTSYGILGATAFFQNDLGTAYGSIGYSADRAPDSWIHGAHARFTYKGLFPVLEFSADLENTMPSRYSSHYLFFSEKNASLSLDRQYADGISFNGSAKVYVPLNLSGGGWSRGIIPQASLTFSNDALNTSEAYAIYTPVIGHGNTKGMPFFIGSKDGKKVPLTRMSTGIRAYSMLGTASSGIYPRWGIGMEVGYGFRPGAEEMFSPDAYAFTYGYLPGLMDTHGIKLTVTAQYQFDGRFPESYIKVLPRGVLASDAQSYIGKRYPVQSTFTADYAFPCLPLDCSWLGPLAYVKNLEVTGFFDYGLYSGSKQFSTSSMFSTGAEVCFRLSNLLWIPYDTRIGISYSYSGGKLWDKMSADDIISGSPHSVSAVFSVDL